MCRFFVFFLLLSFITLGVGGVGGGNLLTNPAHAFIIESSDLIIGGAAHLHNSNANISNINISHNKISPLGIATTCDGGALYVAARVGITVYLYNVSFNNNKAADELSTKGNGGAIRAIITGTVPEAIINIEKTSFSGNFAQLNGGAIMATGIKMHIGDNSSFINNISRSDGGALYANSEMTVTDGTTFQNNETKSKGGAILLTSENSSLNFEGNDIKFVGNQTFTTSQGYAGGGAILMYGSIVNFNNCDVVFMNNLSDMVGGAMTVYGAELNFNDQSRVVFSGNYSYLSTINLVSSWGVPGTINFHDGCDVSFLSSGKSGIYAASSSTYINFEGGNVEFNGSTNGIRGGCTLSFNGGTVLFANHSTAIDNNLNLYFNNGCKVTFENNGYSIYSGTVSNSIVDINMKLTLASGSDLTFKVYSSPPIYLAAGQAGSAKIELTAEVSQIPVFLGDTCKIQAYANASRGSAAVEYWLNGSLSVRQTSGTTCLLP